MPMPRRCALAVALLTALPSCALVPRQVESVSIPEDRIFTGAFFIPSLRVKADEDPDERNLGIELDADLKVGSGAGLHLALRPAMQSEGMNTEFRTRMFHTEHREQSSGETVDHYAITASGVLWNDFVEGEGLAFGPHVGLGFGVGFFDFDFHYDDELTALVDIHFGMTLEVVDRLAIFVEAGGMLHGYPGETIATTGCLGFGGRIGF